ncbi:MAG: BamA/TamA family outer membrane protein [Gemmatimonadetes bacterium]|nr:BamA/TamA family outer membrane protein [Gemmatimonadota bacterium]
MKTNLASSPRYLAAVLVGLGTAVHSGASAQASAPVGRANDGKCDGPVVTRVFVDNHPVYYPAIDSVSSRGLVARAGDWVRSTANLLHHRTRKGFIRRELLLDEGHCFDPLLAAESQRLLRELPIMADAHVYPVHVGEREVHLVAETRDRWSLKLDVRWEYDERLRITQASFDEENFLGAGVLLGAYATEQDERRDLGIRLSALQFAGTRLNARAGVGRTRTGDFIYQSLTYPYVGEVGSWALTESYSMREDQFRYSAPEGTDFGHVNLPIQSRTAIAAISRRFGAPGKLSVLGVGVSWEEVTFDDYPDSVMVVVDSDFGNPKSADAATVEAIEPHVLGRRALRLNALAARRSVRHVTTTGLDALRNDQEVRVGAQLLATVGTTVGGGRWLSSDGRFHEVRGTLSLFLGAAGGRWVVNSTFEVGAALPVLGSAGSGAVRDLLAETGTHLYWRPGAAPRHTLLLALTGVGTWRSSLPFQVNMGGPHALRGYHRDALPVARRVVAHLEDRVLLGGPFRKHVDLGLAFFVDAGAGWGEGTPFGVDTGLKLAAGAGLRIGAPAGARRAVRLDFAAPIEDGRLGQLQFRVGVDAISLLDRIGDRRARRGRTPSPFGALMGR